MKLLIKGLAVILSVALLAACGKDDTAAPAADGADTAAPAAAAAPALPVTIDDLKAAAAKGDYSATDLLRLLEQAQAGDKEAQFQLGAAYNDGLRIKQDYAKAYEWISKASAQNHSTAHFLMGTFYHFGNHVAADPQKALEYYDKSYKGGYKPAKATADELRAFLNKK